MSLSPEQIEFRKTGIGGSESAAILGIHPYLSAMELYARKVGLVTDNKSNTRLRCGSFLEGFVVSEYEAATGNEAVVDDLRCAMKRHSDHDFALANLDGWVFDGSAEMDTIFEAKTVGSRAWWSSWDNGKTVPLYIQCQVQHYMWVMGAKRAEVAALVDMSDLRVFKFDRDDGFIDNKLEPAVIKFWNHHVLKKRPPMWDGSTSCYEALKVMHPPADAEGAAALPELLDPMLEYQALGEQESVIKGRRKEIKNQVLATMGDHQEAGLGDGFLLKRDKRNALKLKELAA